jgi:hypothetical protein
MALAKVGATTITSLDDTTSTSAIVCKSNLQLSIQEVGRSHNWNCLTKSVVLTAVTQDPINTNGLPAGTTPWAVNTVYAANAYVTYGNALYQALIGNTSTYSFVNDLTAGFWFETDVFNSDPFGEIDCGGGGNYPSGWAYKYSLPSDFILLSSLNDQYCDQAEIQYEIQGLFLYTNSTQAVIKYVAYITDSTIYDSLFTSALVFMLASRIATTLRQDDTAIADKMVTFYLKALRDARVKDAGERKPRRFSPVNNSRFVASRYFSTNS